MIKKILYQTFFPLLILYPLDNFSIKAKDTSPSNSSNIENPETKKLNNITKNYFSKKTKNSLSSPSKQNSSSKVLLNVATTPGQSSSEEITVYGQNQNKSLVGTSTLSAKAMNDFNFNTLDQAANVIPGVNVANTGGSRNERILYVRGFNRFQVPLLIDGVRIYLPSDNRLDFGRFVTPDIAEIQIDKGYASVIDGPDGMGGMINLVTRKPKKELEAEVRSNINLGHDAGYGGYNVYGYIGTKHKKWYAQLSFDENNIDHTDLSSNFKPTPSQGKGKRLLSGSLDWRLNTKIGFTPNETDEYVLSYIRQQGEKGAPVNTIDPLKTQRFWDWPTWNIDSLTFMTSTKLNDLLTLKFRLYRNSFDNVLRSYDNINENTQSIKKAFNSYYYDVAYGGDTRLYADISDKDTLNFTFYGRLDQHNEHTQSFPGPIRQPNLQSEEESYSIALENTYDILPQLQLTTAGSYDWRILDKAQGYNKKLINYPLANKGAFNGQARLAWQIDDKTKSYVSFSDRVRFPTLFERFSSRFGGAISNPTLSPERAKNYEVGASHNFKNVVVAGDVFVSQVSNIIVSFPMIYQDIPVVQDRNAGHGTYAGFELSTEIQLLSKLTLGGNYTYTHRTLHDPSDESVELTDVPKQKAFIYMVWNATSKLRLMPSLDIASNRWTTDSSGDIYFRTGKYVNMALDANYNITDRLELGLGASNLLDQNYQLAAGYPEMGRNFYFKLRFIY
ncbi:Vitamin B12 transporter BtuB [Commensalibacter sp. Nvir]|uniref:TonB-dependent receptor plug domain-containing protein n=1 Tax=Commensalibacter sp. Nvir TaxID=3069817 RepID=UPI002D2DAC78|nr:Vitamin B12 transporter BtuB [Commensalibacter sp. Nvir]